MHGNDEQKKNFWMVAQCRVKDAEGLVRNAVEHGSAANPVAAWPKGTPMIEKLLSNRLTPSGFGTLTGL